MAKLFDSGTRIALTANGAYLDDFAKQRERVDGESRAARDGIGPSLTRLPRPLRITLAALIRTRTVRRLVATGPQREAAGSRLFDVYFVRLFRCGTDSWGIATPSPSHRTDQPSATCHWMRRSGGHSRRTSSRCAL